MRDTDYRSRASGDEEPDAFHFALYDGDEVVGCVTYVRRQFEGSDAYQLRGMAVTGELRGKGLGRRLYERSLQHVSDETGNELFWCNSQMRAKGFYERMGWNTAGEVFEIDGVGPHVRMVLQPRSTS
ncbi:MAG: GNAT family N-acetyltransferase [Planctomycetota bacterium]|nr:GNAT family N-acetyltransferase [Planctomycetota bacterium]